MSTSLPHLAQGNLPISSLLKHPVAILVTSAVIRENIPDERIKYDLDCCSIGSFI